MVVVVVALGAGDGVVRSTVVLVVDAAAVVVVCLGLSKKASIF